MAAEAKWTYTVLASTCQKISCYQRLQHRVDEPPVECTSRCISTTKPFKTSVGPHADTHVGHDKDPDSKLERLLTIYLLTHTKYLVSMSANTPS